MNFLFDSQVKGINIIDGIIIFSIVVGSSFARGLFHICLRF